MKKGKKIFKLLVLAVLTICMLLPVVACSTASSDKVDTSENVLNVKISDNGYGTTYIEKIKEKFEQTFAEEGYEIKILAPDAELNSTKVITDANKGVGADVYFFGELPEIMATSKQGQLGTGSAVLDITESVLKAKPIKFDKTEEDCTVLSKIPGAEEEIFYDGKYWAIPYVQGLGGLAVNTAVLDKYDLEIPKTTNELFACADEIMANTLTDGKRPFGYSLSGNNYPVSLLNGWLMQSLGLEKYSQYQSMQVNGQDMENAYEVFGGGADGTEGEFAEAITDVLTAFYEVADPYATNANCFTYDFREAQGLLMKDRVAFFPVGDWMFNEERAIYPDKMHNVTFINVPVISSLGTKLFGAGTTYNKSDADSEKILKAIIDLVDQNKTVEEIKASVQTSLSVTLADADVLRVAEARGAINDRSGANIWISKNTKKADLAITFLRFCASSDCGALIANETKTNNPFAPDALANTEYSWFDSVNSIINNDYATRVRTSNTYGLRKRYSLSINFPLTGQNEFVHLSQQLTPNSGRISIYKIDDTTFEVVKGKDMYRTLAVDKQKEIYDHAKKRITELKGALG